MQCINSLILFILIFWAGFFSAISFFESWLKFRAEGITIPIGLRVGKKIFNSLNRVEIFFLMVIIILNFLSNNFLRWQLITAVLILLTQSFFLLPLLNQRADRIIAGEDLSSTWHHKAYILLDVVKFFILTSSAFRFMNIT